MGLHTNTNPPKKEHLFTTRIFQQNLSNGLKGISIGGLAVIAKDGVDSVRTAVRELEKHGYLVRSQKRDKRGCMSVNEYIVYENPDQNPEYAPANKKTENFHTDSKDKSAKNGSVKPNVPVLENSTTYKNSGENPIFSELPLLEKLLQKNPRKIKKVYCDENVMILCKNREI